MKKLTFSNEFKVVIGILLIILIAVISNVYHIDFNKYLDKVNDNISNTSKTTKKEKVELIDCIDGDTAKFSEKGIIHTYRFLGINTKEYTKIKEKYGYEASKYTCDKLRGAKNIYVSYETTSTHYDDYKRHLVWVYVNDELLQEKLLENGLAEVKYVYTKLTYLKRLYKAESVAKKNKLNIFKNYKEKKYKDKTYTIVFKENNSTKDINVKEGNIMDPINNPVMEDKAFKGWSLNGRLYDFSIPIKEDLILTAEYDLN